MKKFNNKSEFRNFLKNASANNLKNAGFGIWQKFDKKDKDTHYLKPNQIHFLIPGEYIDFIPKGIKLINLSGKSFIYKKGSKYDLAFGCLPYGIIK